MSRQPSSSDNKLKTDIQDEASGVRFYCQSAVQMIQCVDCSIALTVTSPPYWNAIDYDTHANKGRDTWYRERAYGALGKTFNEYLDRITEIFKEVHRVTMEGGYCAVVIGTILHEGKHYATPMAITERMVKLGWLFHQDIIWNKVTGGVKRAGVYIKHPKFGYYYPNIMTEYILVFRKEGEMRRGEQTELPVDELFKRDIANNIWHIAPVPPRSIDHPCPYPEELVRRLILLYSMEGDEVLDPFLGSGQTAIAATKLKRSCVGYDIEPDYIRIAHERVMIPPEARPFNLLPKFEKIAS